MQNKEKDQEKKTKEHINADLLELHLTSLNLQI